MSQAEGATVHALLQKLWLRFNAKHSFCFADIQFEDEDELEGSASV